MTRRLGGLKTIMKKNPSRESERHTQRHAGSHGPHTLHTRETRHNVGSSSRIKDLQSGRGLVCGASISTDTVKTYGAAPTVCTSIIIADSFETATSHSKVTEERIQAHG
ncbi:hypothetical protein TNCV_644121 [Trichonephila clavipes]|nr:hypothetical protein TNCV_644121 [Trichonephila clavipes]